jgi:hypothetical protein
MTGDPAAADIAGLLRAAPRHGQASHFCHNR